MTRRGSYSSLDPVHSVVLSSRLRPSSSPHLRTSFSRKASPFLTTTTKTRTRSRSGHPFLAPGALFHPPFSPFSLVSHFCLLDIVPLRSSLLTHSLRAPLFSSSLSLSSLSFPLALSFSLSCTPSRSSTFFIYVRPFAPTFLPACIPRAKDERAFLSPSYRSNTNSR